MTEPTEHDVSSCQRPARELWDATRGRPWPRLFDPKSFNEKAVRDTWLLSRVGYAARIAVKH